MPDAPRSESSTESSRLEARLAAILDVALDCIVTVDHEGRFIDFNPAAERTFGYTKAEAIGRDMTELIVPPHLRAGHRAGMGRMLAGHPPQMLGRRIEITAMRKDGSEFPVELAIARLAVDGPPIFTAHLRDITDRVRASAELSALHAQLERRIAERTEALQRAQADYRGIFENAMEGLYQSSIDGRFLGVNPAMARMLGYGSPAEMIAAVNNIETLFYVQPRRRAEFIALIGAGEGVTDFESEVYRRDGSRVWISESVRAVRDALGVIDHFEGVAIDITRERETARMLAEAKEAADTANRAKSQFLASMSHELRTPLNGILGYTQILRRDPETSGRQRQGIDVIHHSAEHLLGLINDVLDLSKIEAGRLELNLADFDLAGLLANIEELFHPRAREKNLRFEAMVSPALPRLVRGDEQRLRQVLLNLVGNAIKFTDTGRVHLRVERGGVNRVRFAVRDTGPGMTAAELARLFEPYSQVGDTRRQADGTGLGLAISHRLVGCMGGRIEVESEPGRGSRFAFEIDLPDSYAVSVPVVGASRVLGLEGASRRALVVDDGSDNRAVLAELLRSTGFVVDEADCGEAALATAAQAAPDLVLMDLRMPGMGGLAAARLLRARFGDAVRIIAVSASAYDLDRQACLDAGCDEFLPKPVREEALWPLLERLLGVTFRREAPPEPTRAPFPVAQPPPADDARAFYDLAAAGDVVGIRARAEALKVRRPDQAAFAESILELAGRFKMKAIRQFVAPWRGDAPTMGGAEGGH